jgi:hypothetical protein
VFISNRIATGIGADPHDRLPYHVDSGGRPTGKGISGGPLPGLR